MMDEMPSLAISTPQAVENLQLPSPELVTYYRNLENRTLWLDTEVDETWLEFIRNIFHWNEEDKGKPIDQRRPIRLMLFSYGGNLDINNAFIDVINASQTPVWAINVGQACSAACFISIAAHKRFALPNATYLIHQGGGDNFSGTYQQLMSAILEYQRKIEELEAYLKKTTKIPEDVLEERITTEWFISAKEAVEYGICDKIITSLDEIL
jgi:ATP-dependent Clp protease protease subunit